MNMMISRKWLGTALLAAVFIASFVPYEIGLSMRMLIIAPAILFFTAFLVLPVLYRQQGGGILRTLLDPKLTFFAFLLPATSSIMAVGRGEWSSVGYACLMAAVLVACRITLCCLPLRSILRAFAVAGLVAVPIFFIVEWHAIVHSSLSGVRLRPAETQPNAIGFIFAGFTIVFAWNVLQRRGAVVMRMLYAVLACAAGVVILLLSSRASLLAMVCAGSWAAALWGRVAMGGRGASFRAAVTAAFVVVVLGLLVIVARPSSVNRISKSVSKELKLTSSYRGFGTGMSGRIPRWIATIEALGHKGGWAFGFGYRSSNRDLGFSVDNGYLTILYEGGIVALIAIVLQMGWALWTSSRQYLAQPSDRDCGASLLIAALIVGLLVNNLFDRYLFGLGNPYSLIGLFVLLLRRRDFQRRLPGKAYVLTRPPTGFQCCGSYDGVTYIRDVDGGEGEEPGDNARGLA